MAKILATFKAIFTRLIFSAHSTIAIWQVTQYKKDPVYWYLSAPIGVLFLEGIFTLAIKKNQEWRWFCPSVFLYLASVVPAIWLLELDKMERRNKLQTINIAAAMGKDLNQLDKFLGVKFNLPDLQVDAETWVTLIEQFLMLILIVGRWMLPKGDLTKDQLSQLLLVYIGTAADIIEFFDSFKDNKIAGDKLLVFLTLGIWSWSLIQFTIVLSATRSRKPRGGGTIHEDEFNNECCSGCCGIDAWGIALNIILQDAPFLTFRLLIIIHYEIISYMNVFFTCKNTLVILLQLYRLYVVHSENHKHKNILRQERYTGRHRKQHHGMDKSYDNHDLYIISNGKYDRKIRHGYDDYTDLNERRYKNKKKSHKSRKDTGYSTASSHTTSKSNEEKYKIRQHRHRSESEVGKHKSRKYDSSSDPSSEKENKSRSSAKKRHRVHPKSDDERYTKKSSKHEKRIVEVTEDSESSSKDKKNKSKRRRSRKRRSSSISSES